MITIKITDDNFFKAFDEFMCHYDYYGWKYLHDPENDGDDTIYDAYCNLYCRVQELAQFCEDDEEHYNF